MAKLFEITYTCTITYETGREYFNPNNVLQVPADNVFDALVQMGKSFNDGGEPYEITVHVTGVKEVA